MDSGAVSIGLLWPQAVGLFATSQRVCQKRLGPLLQQVNSVCCERISVCVFEQELQGGGSGHPRIEILRVLVTIRSASWLQFDIWTFIDAPAFVRSCAAARAARQQRRELLNLRCPSTLWLCIILIGLAPLTVTLRAAAVGCTSLLRRVSYMPASRRTADVKRSATL
jgi:hypothetical protein